MSAEAEGLTIWLPLISKAIGGGPSEIGHLMARPGHDLHIFQRQHGPANSLAGLTSGHHDDCETPRVDGPLRVGGRAI